MKSFIAALIAAIFACVVLVRPPSLNAQDDPLQDKFQINLADQADLDLVGLVQVLANSKKMNITALGREFPGQQATKILFFGDYKVDSDSMFEVVQSILRTNGFAIVNAELDGQMRIVPLGNVRPFAEIAPDNNVEGIAAGTYVTGVFPLQHATEKEVQDYITQFIYANKNAQVTPNITSIPNRNTLIITETVSRLTKIKDLIQKLDVPAEKQRREFYQVKHFQAEELKQQLIEILDLSVPQVANAAAARRVKNLKVNTILRTNQLLFSGTTDQIADALELVTQLDIEDQLKVVTYQFQNTSAKQIDELIRDGMKGIEEAQVERIYQSDINEQANQLIATTRPEVHAKIARLKQQLDTPAALATRKSPMKFYTLKNVKAIEILDTLQAIERRVNSRPGTNASRGRQTGITTVNGVNSVDQNGFGQQFGQGFGSPVLNQRPGGPFDSGQGLGRSPFDRLGGSQASDFGASALTDFAQFAQDIDTADKLIPGEAKITIDENTNTLIVVAEPAIQQLYAELIAKLDVRRPQVLIEVHLVTITGSKDLDLGLDVQFGDRTGDRQAFGVGRGSEVSSVDMTSGALALIPGLGFNGTLVDAATAEVVIKALSRNRRARVDTAPRILVNDNATGLLSSVSEQPFDAVNVGNATTTTSFGGFATAGTIISVTPQISDDDYLNLDFDVQVNVFTEEAATGIPPRNTDQVTSTVSIPDGNTIIVGGLTRQRATTDRVGIPFFENIPLLKRIGSESDNAEQQRFFVFIRPIILRDDKFRDLRYISETERRAACIPDDLPASSPVLIR